MAKMIRLYPLMLLPVALILRYLVGIFLLASSPAKGVSWSDAGAKWHHPLKSIDDDLLQKIGYSDESHYKDFNETLDSILIPRVPGTEGHERVRQYILMEMNALGWKVEQDVFADRTPYGRKEFANIIATLNPNACRNLVIACHYDSLSNREFTFMGATDSAVPCAMMIHNAKLLDPLLKKLSKKDHDVTLQFIFFDGEEAFRRWSRTDSLYGSRHLAEKWNNKKAFHSTPICTDKDYVSYLDRMDAMLLLDLIGTADPKFYSYFLDTHQLYLQLVNAEYRLNNLKLLEVHPPETSTHYFQSRSTIAFVEDDHIPFMKRGVPIIHLIPSPFPPVWHKESDNRNSLHHPTINNLNKILRVFIVQYLHLDTPQEALKL